MDDRERKLQIIDLTVSIVFFIVGCIIGNFVMNIYGTWWAFNIPAIGFVGIGELLWWRIRKRLYK